MPAGRPQIHRFETRCSRPRRCPEPAWPGRYRRGMTTLTFDPTLARCWWSGAESERPDALMVIYHDGEWGTPCHDDTELFERLALESFQAGLSWSTILRKRETV